MSGRLARVRRLEDAGDPWLLVARWLEEAHRHGDLVTYTLSTLDLPLAESPFAALPERAREGVRASSRAEGHHRSHLRELEDRAARDVVFLLELVMETEREALGLLHTATLRADALRWRMRALHAEGLVEPDDDAERSGRIEAWAAWRGAVVDLAAGLATHERARSLLADHYAMGTDTRFPDTVAALGTLTAMVDALLGVAAGTAPRGRRIGPGTVGRRAIADAPAAATAIAERIRAQTLDLVDDHLAGAAVIARRLRAGEGDEGLGASTP